MRCAGSACRPRPRRACGSRRRIGFRSDPIARALRGGRTELVGVVGGSLDDHWHQEFVAALQRALHDHGLRMLLADAGGDRQEELALARDLAAQRVDGLIVLPIDPLADDWRTIARATPTVSVNASLPSPAGAIRFDSGAVSRSRSITFAASATAGSRAGRRNAPVPRAPDTRRVRCGRPATGPPGRAAALTRHPRPTAVFALSDSIAYGVYAACRELRAGGAGRPQRRRL